MMRPYDLDDPKAIRAQYHVRRVDGHLHIWSVRNLLSQAQPQDIFDHPVAAIAEVDTAHWGDSPATPREILTHADLIAAADLTYPILLCQDDRLIDGMHRILAALRIGQTTLPARKIHLPPPEHIDRDLKDLPYDEDPGLSPTFF